MRLTIGRKLGISLGIALGLMLAVVVADIIGLNTLRTISSRSVAQVQAAQTYDRLVNAQSRAFTSLYEYLGDGTAGPLNNFKTAHAQAAQLVQPAIAYCNGCHPSTAPNISTQLKSLQSQQDTSSQLMTDALAAYETNPTDAAARVKIRQAEDIIQGQLSLADQVQKQHADFVAAQIAAEDRRARDLLQTNAILSGLAVLISVAVAVVVTRGIVGSVMHLRNAAEDISRGDMDVRIEVKTGDEMEDMAKSIERMRVSLKAAIERLRGRQSAGA